ncbi:hypothetical protein BCAH1134_C0148 (plasmid) [Bacillus cereus AH1134]|nr:hypothetical protein BCAH1134_C0148 [Bacillus cereus AH1134]
MIYLIILQRLLILAEDMLIKWSKMKNKSVENHYVLILI